MSRSVHGVLPAYGLVGHSPDTVIIIPHIPSLSCLYNLSGILLWTYVD